MTPTTRATWPFFVLAFAITWSLQVPGVLALRGALPGSPGVFLLLAGLGLFGPLLAATFLSLREGGTGAVRKLYAPLARCRVHFRWYFFALLLPGLVLSGALGLLHLVGRDGPLAYVPTLSGVAFGVVVSLAEEVGWRGYAFPRLSARFGSFAAATSLGVLWYVWHLPMFAAQGVALSLVLVLLLYFVGASLFLAWIQAGTGGSLLLVTLGHLGAHLNNSHRALPDDVLPLLVQAIVYAALGLSVTRPRALFPERRAGNSSALRRAV